MNIHVKAEKQGHDKNPVYQGYVDTLETQEK